MSLLIIGGFFMLVPHPGDVIRGQEGTKPRVKKRILILIDY